MEISRTKLAKNFLTDLAVDNLQESMEKLEELSDEYFHRGSSTSPKELDEIKSAMLSWFGTYSYYMAEVYSKQGPNRIYLEELRKQVKQQYVDHLVKVSIEPKYSRTKAEKDVENNKEYIEDLLAMEKFKKILMEFEKREKFFLMVINAITQSIAITRKEADLYNQ